ncbi:tRNA(Arg) A34 adenosine deaminase TadA [Marivirga sericea]|uniref:tRNA(Arg) A34 adenosine deaminase TadA n=1 Tax=Marivirga sericea TaxID=1028 RepID=A0A1X7IMQ6_9BACT|nr:nucleoside deaminase [Marivirga sericea]SMG16249.1 tRNA(Arg) A34 adenosine deaminase TadA [Marivirga sericea]
MNTEFWMKMAIDLAKESKTPFGAVLVDPEGQHVSGYNTTILDGAVAHAEINVLNKIKQLDYDTAEELTLITTVEPCPMCMSAIIWAGLGEVIYGCDIPNASKYGKQITIRARDVAAESWYVPIIRGGILAEECESLFK